MPTVRITQLHKVEQAKAELRERGHEVTHVAGGGPWVITYTEVSGVTKTRAKKATS